MCEESRNLSKETYKNKLKKIIRENERSLEIKKKLIK